MSKKEKEIIAGGKRLAAVTNKVAFDAARAAGAQAAEAVVREAARGAATPAARKRIAAAEKKEKAAKAKLKADEQKLAKAKKALVKKEKAMAKKNAKKKKAAAKTGAPAKRKPAKKKKAAAEKKKPAKKKTAAKKPAAAKKPPKKKTGGKAKGKAKPATSTAKTGAPARAAAKKKKKKSGTSITTTTTKTTVKKRNPALPQAVKTSLHVGGGVAAGIGGMALVDYALKKFAPADLNSHVKSAIYAATGLAGSVGCAYAGFPDAAGAFIAPFAAHVAMTETNNFGMGAEGISGIIPASQAFPQGNGIQGIIRSNSNVVQGVFRGADLEAQRKAWEREQNIGMIMSKAKRG